MDLVVTGFETFLIGPICDIAATLLFALDRHRSSSSTTNGTAWAGLAQMVEQLKTTPPPDSPTRQFVVAWSVLTIGAFFFYFFFSGLNYYVVHRKCGNLKHKPFAGQVGAEIAMASKAIPIMGLLTAPIVVLECQGYSQLYGPGTAHGYSDYGHGYTIVTAAIFLLFTDMCIYWIHRGLHMKPFYQSLHKDHHKWKSPTPFASHAFHPVDGWVQSVPYHIFAFVVPMHKLVFLGLFIFVNIWTVSIHDGASISPPKWLNGAAHHTYHHKDFNYNYGQYFVFWDWLGGTIRDPYATGRILHVPESKKNT